MSPSIGTCKHPTGEAYSQPLLKLAQAGKVRFLVPEHFQYEVTRIIVMRALKGNKSVKPKGANWMNSTLQSLQDAPIDTFVVGINFVLLGKLAETVNLDAPDVPYFHLARESGIAIATRDTKIIQACDAWSVGHWVPEMV